MPEATESSTLQAGLASEPPLTSLPTGAHDAAKPPQPPADAGRRWSSRAPKTIARFVAEAAPPPSLLRTIVEREGVVPSDVSTSLKSSLKQPQGGAQRKPRATDAAVGTAALRCPKGCGFTTTKSKAMGGHARGCPLRDGAPTPLAHDPAGDEPGGAAAAREPAPGATAESDSEDDQPLSRRPRGQGQPLPVEASASAEAGPSGEAEAHVEAPQEPQEPQALQAPQA